MKVVKRSDVEGAYVVVSGPNQYDVYLGSDPSYPPCSCADATYKDTYPCRHVRCVREWQKENNG